MESAPPPSSDSSLERKLQRLAPSNGDSRAFLLIVEGPRAGRLHLLGDRDTLVGRSDEVDICISDEAVSHRHAAITRRQDGYYLVDLDSRNGTLVNGVMVSQRKLRKRDEIRIGETTLVFLEEGASESTQTVALQKALPSPHQSSALGFSSNVGMGGPQVTTTSGQEANVHPLVDLVRKVLAIGRFAQRNAWVLIPLPLLGIGIGAYTLKLFPAPETATAVVRLTHFEQRNPVDPRVGYNQHEPAAFFEDPISNFAGPDLIKRTLTSLDAPTHEGAVDAALNGLKIERAGFSAGTTSAYVTTFAAKDPTVQPYAAVNFLETYLDTYLTHEVDKSIRVLKSEAGFLHDELGKVEKELRTVEEELRAYRSKHIDSLPEQAAAVMEGKHELAQRRAELQLEVERARIQIANVKSQLDQTDAVVARRFEELKSVREDIATKKRALGDLRSKGLMDDHPEVRQLAMQIDRLEREVKSKINSDVTDLERTTNPHQLELRRRLQEHQGELRVAESALGNVNERLAVTAGQVQQVPEVETTLIRLTRDQKALQDLRTRLFEEHRKKTLQIDLETANVRARYEIVTRAEQQNAMTRKFLATRLGGGLVIGLVIALLIAGLLETRRLLKRHPQLLRS